MNAFLKWLNKPGTPKLYDEMHSNIDKFIAKANDKFKEHDYPIKLTNWYSVWSILYTRPGRYHWMFQYYTKDAGINMSWVGSGRLLFSLEWKKEDYDRLLERLLEACEAMSKGGWWDEPKVNIKQKVSLEMVRALVKNAVGM